MSENTKRLRNHVASYRSLSAHRQNCLNVCDEVDQAQVDKASLGKQLQDTEMAHNAETKRIAEIESRLTGFIDACPMCTSGVECDNDMCFAARELLA